MGKIKSEIPKGHFVFRNAPNAKGERAFVKGKVDFPQIGLEKGTTERGIPKVSKSC